MNKQFSAYKSEGLTVILVTKTHTISEVLEAFENVMRGQGYFFDGKHLELTENE